MGPALRGNLRPPLVKAADVIAVLTSLGLDSLDERDLAPLVAGLIGGAASNGRYSPSRHRPASHRPSRAGPCLALRRCHRFRARHEGDVTASGAPPHRRTPTLPLAAALSAPTAIKVELRGLWHRADYGKRFALPVTSTSVQRKRGAADASSVSIGSPVVSTTIL